MFVFKLTNSVLASCLYSLIIPHGFSDRVVKKTFEFLGQYSKFHEVDLAIISQFQYNHEATTYESFSDQSGTRSGMHPL